MSDRVYKIGQKDSVNIYYLLANNTIIEEKIAKMIDEKRKIMNKVTDEEETDESSLLTQLIEDYKQQIEEHEKMKIISKQDYQNAKIILKHGSSTLDDLDKNLCNGIIISHLRGKKMPAYQLMNFHELVKNEL